MEKKDIVRLMNEERETLRSVVKKLSGPSQKVTMFRSNRLIAFVIVVIVCSTKFAIGGEESRSSFQELRRCSAAEAHQAVAVDEISFYAISNRSIARYEKSTGKQTKKWDAPSDSGIRHLNSGAIIESKLYCAHSNWPQKPLKNSIEIFDAATLKRLTPRQFPGTEGAINWIERYRGHWWVVFAFYGDASSVRRTRVVRYDDEWKPNGEWTFPDTVIRRFLPNSNSGGSFGPNGLLYVTGHDHAELYVLRIPAAGDVLEHIATVPAPIAGQGIAWDRTDIGMLYGIIRSRKQVVRMRVTHATEYEKLQQRVTWTRDKRNPILPPRSMGHFDSTRCMNPYVTRIGDQYHLYYSGGDDRGVQRIGRATASVNDISKWTRHDPLFETGKPGSFDARWCVLPHVVKFAKDRWHLYYTGNAGRGTGLSAFPGIGLATSENSQSWTRFREEPVLAVSGNHGDPDAIGIAGGSVVPVKRADGHMEWWFYYTGCPTIGRPLTLNQQKTICLAVSNDGIRWRKRGAVMLRDPAHDYEDIGVAGPVVLRRNDGSFRMWYSAIGTRWGYYSICYAESDDGIHWRRGAKYGENLQLEPAGNGWERQMVEYPSLIPEGNRLRLFYCGNGYGKTGIGTALSSPLDGQE